MFAVAAAVVATFFFKFHSTFDQHTMMMYGKYVPFSKNALPFFNKILFYYNKCIVYHTITAVRILEMCAAYYI